MATKLGLFNGALIELGDAILSDTGENVKSGRTLNAVYDQVVKECLKAGSWNFAMETIQADADTGVEPNFGYTEVFAKPADWLRTIGVSADEDFAFPLTTYYDDSTFWSSNNTPIYVRYVSGDTGLGLDLSRWPVDFSRYVELELADRTCMTLTQSKSLKDDIMKARDKQRRRALNVDAMNEPNPRFSPPGTWTSSRGGRTGSGDRGRRNNFTG